jgi:hypothetical protein
MAKAAQIHPTGLRDANRICKNSMQIPEAISKQQA